MAQDDFFSDDKDTIGLNGLDAIIRFTRYKSSEPDTFLNGLELAEDLTTQSGILYTEGTEMSPVRINRLTKLKESNPNINLSFKLTGSRIIPTKRKITCLLCQIYCTCQSSTRQINCIDFSVFPKNLSIFIITTGLV